MDPSPVGYYSYETWTEVHRHVSNHKLHVVLQSQDNQSRIAHFKYGYELQVDPDFRGPLAANERISYEIAELMELPVMPVQFYRHKGMPGHIRWAVPSTAQNWSFADIWVRRDIPRYFNDPEVLVRMFVFDVFVCNHDRHEGNILYTVSSSNGKHDLYLIDHDLALFGTERKWRRFSFDDPHWFDADRFLRLEEVKGLINGFSDLLPAVEMVEAITDAKIDEMVNGVRDLEELAYLDDRESHVIRSMLKLRKTRIELMLRKWCRENGKV